MLRNTRIFIIIVYVQLYFVVVFLFLLCVVHRYLNMDKLLPCYKYTVTTACLKVWLIDK